MDFMTISLADPFPAVWNHDNRRFFATGTPFRIDWWAVWGWKVYRKVASDRNPGVMLAGRQL
jgi:hypothetical protein